MYIHPKNIGVSDHARRKYRERVLAEMFDVRVLNNLTEEQVIGEIRQAVSECQTGKKIRERLAPWLKHFHQEKGGYYQTRDIYYHPKTHAVFICTAPSKLERHVITCFRATCKQCGQHECQCHAGVL